MTNMRGYYGGYVAMWVNKKRGTFFIGAHWGKLSDGLLPATSRRFVRYYRYEPKCWKRTVLKKFLRRPDMYKYLYEKLAEIPDELIGSRECLNETKTPPIPPNWRSKEERDKINEKRKQSCKESAWLPWNRERLKKHIKEVHRKRDEYNERHGYGKYRKDNKVRETPEGNG